MPPLLVQGPPPSEYGGAGAPSISVEESEGCPGEGRRPLQTQVIWIFALRVPDHECACALYVALKPLVL